MVVIDVIAFELGNARMKYEIRNTIFVVDNRVQLQNNNNEQYKQNQKQLVDVLADNRCIRSFEFNN
jgi:hypothetical protein